VTVRLPLFSGVIAFAITPLASLAAEHGAMAHEAREPRAAPASRDARAPVAGASSVPSCAFDAGGRLWAAWVEGGRVLVSSSPDAGSSWGRAVPVTPVPVEVDDNGEGRPKIALGEKGVVLVTWTERLATPYSGHVRFSRSVDGGRTFSPPVTVNDDPAVTGHRFDALVAGPGSRVTVAWLDKRDRDRARAGGRPYAGAALYTALSLDGGATFLPNRKVADHVCECCRIGGTRDAAGKVVLFFRAIFGPRTRDHALVRLDEAGVPGPVRRATFDGWEIDGCPHQGPALAVGDDGVLHLAWYTAEGPNGRGVFVSRLAPDGTAVGAPVRVASEESKARHPALLVSGREVVLAWRESRDGVTRILVKRSRDGGATWESPREAARSTGAADQPLLVQGPDGPTLSWFEDTEGLRLLALGPVLDGAPGEAGNGRGVP
jgi:hypothetical protein